MTEIYSLERRRERYMVICVYEITISLVPNLGLEWTYNERTKIKVKPSYCYSAPAWVKIHGTEISTREDPDFTTLCHQA